jgi:hypothetical protein
VKPRSLTRLIIAAPLIAFQQFLYREFHNCVRARGGDAHAHFCAQPVMKTRALQNSYNARRATRGALPHGILESRTKCLDTRRAARSTERPVRLR